MFLGIWVLIICLLCFGNLQKTSCDFEIEFVGTQMGNFNVRAYNPFNIDRIFYQLNSLRAGILASYQLCWGKIIIDPDSMYPQDITQCFMGLYNVSSLAQKYTGHSDLIRADFDRIAKIVFSTQNDCRPILYYSGWKNVSDDCQNQSANLDTLIVKYEDDITLGGNGTQFLTDMLLNVEKMRKLCGFDVLLKAKPWNGDNCSSANLQWLYPLTDKIDTYITNKQYLNLTSAYYCLYQSIYRARSLCISNTTISQQ